MKLAAVFPIFFLAVPVWGARNLTLEEAQQLAARNNRTLKLARLKVDEMGHRRESIRADYFPKVSANASYLYFEKKLASTTTGEQLGLGILPPPFPSLPVTINLAKQNLFLGGVTVAQPLTQLIKVRQGLLYAAGEEDAAKAQAEKGEDEVRYAVEQLYYALLVSQRQRRTEETKVAAAEELLKDAQNAVDTGKALQVAVIGRRAGLLEAKQNLQAARDLEADWMEALNIALGLPIETELSPAEPPRPDDRPWPVEDAIRQALERNPEVQAAQAAVNKARAGVRVAQTAYIPDVSAMAQYFHQEGIPTMPGDFGAVGGAVSFTLFDFGKRREQVRERRAQVEQAEEDLRRAKDAVEQQIRKTHREIERGRSMVAVAREALELRRESERLNKDQFELGLAVKSAYSESKAASASAEVDLFRAEAGWRLALAQLKKQVGAPR